MNQHAKAPGPSNAATPARSHGAAREKAAVSPVVPSDAHSARSAAPSAEEGGSETAGNPTPAPLSSKQIHGLATQATSGTASRMPHFDRIQESFGDAHPIHHVKAFTDGAARKATKAMKANAMTRGHTVAFRGAPSLFTAAHEAAHVIQQQHGVNVPGNVGSVGDRHEQMADDVARRVVSGQSATFLLNQLGNRRPAPKQHAVQQQPVQLASQFSQGELDQEYDAASTAGKVGLGLGGSVWGAGRGALQGAYGGGKLGANTYRSLAGANPSMMRKAGAGLIGGVVGGVGGLAGLVGGMGAGAVTGLGHGLYRGGGSALGAMYRNPRKTAAAGVAGTGIGINTGMIGAGMGGAGVLAGNMATGSILSGGLTFAKGLAGGKRWWDHGQHLQSHKQNRRSFGRGAINAGKVAVSGAHAAAWANKAAGGHMVNHFGQSLFSANRAAGWAQGHASLASTGLQTAGNIGAIGGIVAGTADMFRGASAYKKSRGRKQALADYRLASQSDEDATRNEKTDAALDHIKKLHDKKQRKAMYQGFGGALIAGGSALAATGVGGLAGSGVVLAGMTLQNLPGMVKGAKQFFRNNAEAKRTMTHAQWEGIQNQKIAANRKRAAGAGLMTRAYYGMKRQGLQAHKWYNRKKWADPKMESDGKPQSHAEWSKTATWWQRQTTANWDKSDKMKKKKHLEHATTLLSADAKTQDAAFEALGLNDAKYAHGLNGKELLAQQAGHESWDKVPDDHKAKLLARVMRKGGVKEAAIGVKEKRESDAFVHGRLSAGIAGGALPEGASEGNLTDDTSMKSHLLTNTKGHRAAGYDDQSYDVPAEGVKKFHMKRDYRSQLGAALAPTNTGAEERSSVKAEDVTSHSNPLVPPHPDEHVEHQ